MKNSQKGFIVPLLLVIIALVLIGGGTYVYIQTKKPAIASLPTQATSLAQTSNSQTATTTDTSLPIIETRYTADYNYITGTNGGQTPSQLVFVSPSKNRIIVPVNVAMQISSPIRFQGTGQSSGEDLTGSLMAINPLNQNQIILSTHEADVNSPRVAGDFSFLNRIYSYDLGTSELKLLATTEDKSNPDRELIIIATQSAKVILFSHTQGTGGPCDSFWLKTADRYTFLDMNNLNTRFQTYVVPATKIQKESANDAKCQQNLDAGVGP